MNDVKTSFERCVMTAFLVVTNMIAFLPPPAPGLGSVLLVSMLPVFGLLVIFLYDYLPERIGRWIILFQAKMFALSHLRLQLLLSNGGRILTIGLR